MSYNIQTNGDVADATQINSNYDAIYKLQGEKAINDVSATNSGVIAGSSQVLIDKFLDATRQNNTVDTGNTTGYRQIYNQVRVTTSGDYESTQLSTDGTKLYNLKNNIVYEYTLTVPYDISTIGASTAILSVGLQDTNSYSIRFNKSGDKLYMVGLTNNRIYQYNLSTAWSLSSATYSTQYNPNSQPGTLRQIDFNADGSKMFVLFNDGKIYQYTLITPYAINTANYDNISKTTDTNSRSFSFSKDGLTIYAVKGGNTITYTLLPSAYDISTFTPWGNCSVDVLGTKITNLYIGGTGGSHNSIILYGVNGLIISSSQTSTNYKYVTTLTINPTDPTLLTDTGYMACVFDWATYTDSIIQSVATTIPSDKTKVFVTPLMCEALSTGDSITADVSIDNGAHYTTGIPINTWSQITSANGTQLIVKANLLTGDGSTSPKVSGWRVLLE